MKSDELYIAEIYEKARRQKTKETGTAQIVQDAKNVSDKKAVQSKKS